MCDLPHKKLFIFVLVMDWLIRLLTGKMISPLPAEYDLQNSQAKDLASWMQSHGHQFNEGFVDQTPQKSKKIQRSAPQVMAAETTPTPTQVPVPTPTLLPDAPENPYMSLLKRYFPVDQVNNASNVMFKESGFRPNATNVNSNGTTDYGLFQINSVHSPDIQKQGMTLQDMLDAAKNIQYAAQIYKQQGWNPWYGADSLGLTSRSNR